MDLEQCDSGQLISITEVTEEYYKMMKAFFRNAAAFYADSAEEHTESLLCPEDELAKAEFIKRSFVPPLSEGIIDFVVLLEWQNSNTQPVYPHKAVLHSLHRLEKILKNSSDWELVCDEATDDFVTGPVTPVTDFEVHLLEEAIPAYVSFILNEDHDQILFFPLTRTPKEEVAEKWRILEKLITLKITAQETYYTVALAESLQLRIQMEVGDWIEKELRKVKGAGKNTVLEDMRVLTSTLQDLKDCVIAAEDVITTDNVLFLVTRCRYFDTVAATLESKLYPAVERTMEHLDAYQNSHKNFHPNMRDSSTLCHSFYCALQDLVKQLSDRITKLSTFEKMANSHTLFGNHFLHLLHVLKTECHIRIRRTVDSERKDEFCNDERILMSAVLVLSCFETVRNEWEKLEIKTEELRTAFLVKLTDTICDGTKIYAEALHLRVGNRNIQAKDYETVKMVCAVVNSIEHVRTYLTKLPVTMAWEDVIHDTEDSDATLSLKQQVILLLTHIHNSTNDHMISTIYEIIRSLSIHLRHSVERFANPWLLSPSSTQDVSKLLGHLDEHLSKVHDVMKETIFKHLLCQLWISFLTYISEKFQQGQRAEYARNVKQNVERLHAYFLDLEMEENEEAKELLQYFLPLLDLNSKTTVELQLNYYGQLADLLTSPLEYLGHLAVQAGYKTSECDTIDIFIKVRKGQRIPVRKYHIDQLTVTVELCPNSIFPAQRPVKTRPVFEDLNNPVFDETFEFRKLHSSVLNIKGAVIQLRLENQDYSFSAEAILNFNQAHDMNNIAYMENLPVHLMPLRIFDRSQPSFHVLENRSKWDKRAKSFVTKRLKVTRRRSIFNSCIPRNSYSMCGVSFSRRRLSSPW